MIRVEGLTKCFGNRKVLAEVTFSIQPGECVGLIGQNGAGKTTLLRILATLTSPTSGNIELAGFQLPSDAVRIRSLLGMVAHQTWLFPELTAHQNLEFYARLFGVPSADERIAEMLIWAGLEKQTNTSVRTFSRGMQQRLTLARALLHQPKILLLDEPYSGLDDEAISLWDVALQQVLKTGCTILLATHDLEHLELLTNRCLILVDGQLRADIDRKDLPQKGLASYYRKVISQIPGGRG